MDEKSSDTVMGSDNRTSYVLNVWLSTDSLFGMKLV